MAKVLMIGAGGVATVAAFKIAQNARLLRWMLTTWNS